MPPFLIKSSYFHLSILQIHLDDFSIAEFKSVMGVESGNVSSYLLNIFKLKYVFPIKESWFKALFCLYTQKYIEKN